jgi:replicative DNA helicase
MDSNTAQKPPFDDAAERSVVGCALMNAAETIPLVGVLAIDDFLMPHHREAWAAILRVVDRRMPVDMIAIGDDLKAAGMDERFPDGWQAWAVQVCSEVSTWHNVGRHADVVRAKSTLRKLIALAAEIQSLSYASKPVDEVLGRAREGVAALEVSGGGKGPEKIETLLGGVLDAIEARQRGEAPIGVMSGIRELDDLLTGFKPGRLYLLGGRPGDGKTALAKGIALHSARNGVPVLFFSREMSNTELVERDLAIVSRVPAYRIGGGSLGYADWKKLQNAAGEISTARLWLDDRSTTIERIVAESRKWHATQVRGKSSGELGLIILDYLQLARMTKARPGANREQVVAEMSRALKELAGELRVPALVLSQLNRGAEERGGRPIPSDLRESGALEQDADVILFVYRDIPPEDQETRRKPGPAEIVIGKHRGGPTGIANVHFNTELMHFTDAENYLEEPARVSSFVDRGDDR